MRIPDFFEPQGSDIAARSSCDAIVGLRIASLEYLNEQNVLVTVVPPESIGDDRICISRLK